MNDPASRYKRGVIATLICWALILVLAFGLPTLGLKGPGDEQTVFLIAVSGVLWVPLTIWMLRRRRRREEENGVHDP